jgi:hypothetical protein
VGAPSSAAGGVAGAGRIFVFDRISSELLRAVENPSPEADDAFGAALAGLEGAVVVGAPLDRVAAARAGSGGI